MDKLEDLDILWILQELKKVKPGVDKKPNTQNKNGMNPSPPSSICDKETRNPMLSTLKNLSQMFKQFSDPTGTTYYMRKI